VTFIVTREKLKKIIFAILKRQIIIIVSKRETTLGCIIGSTQHPKVVGNECKHDTIKNLKWIKY
jgi:hypothetical protein